MQERLHFHVGHQLARQPISAHRAAILDRTWPDRAWCWYPTYFCQEKEKGKETMLTARRDKILKWPYSNDRVIGGKFTSRNGFIVAS